MSVIVFTCQRVTEFFFFSNPFFGCYHYPEQVAHLYSGAPLIVEWYGVECVSALHHNKRKTNYYIHLIYSERKLLPEPDIKIATRSVFYDETGKRDAPRKKSQGRTDRYEKAAPSLKRVRFTKATTLP